MSLWGTPASVPASLKVYFEKWTKEASDGNVIVSFPDSYNRPAGPAMMFHCKECYQGLTAPVPSDISTVDYGVQEFVKLHRHAGGHQSFTIKTGPGKTYQVQYTDAAGVQIQQELLSQGAVESLVMQAQHAQSMQNSMQNTTGGTLGQDNWKGNDGFDLGWGNPFNVPNLPAIGTTTVPYYPGATVSPFNPNDWTLPHGGKVSEANEEYAIVNGQKIFWKKDKNGKIIGVLSPEEAANPPKKALKHATGRKFR